jgi:hypothetical protein
MDVEIQQPQEVGKSRVVKVDKDEAWELFTTQACNEGRTVRGLIHSPSSILQSSPYLGLISCSYSAQISILFMFLQLMTNM